MAHRIVPAVSIRCDARAAIEAHDIHLAVCRARRQQLVCSACSDLAERAIRASAVVVSEAA